MRRVENEAGIVCQALPRPTVYIVYMLTAASLSPASAAAAYHFAAAG